MKKGTKMDAFFAKKAKALTPLAFYAGVNGFFLYTIDRTVLGTYIGSILDYTILFLMSFESDMIHSYAAKLLH